MTHATLLDRARQGDGEAIAALMNQSLASRGIHVRAWWQDGCLWVAADSMPPPDQGFLVEFVRRGMLGLGSAAVATVAVAAYEMGASEPLWSTHLDLVPTPQSPAVGKRRDAPERPVPDARLKVPPPDRRSLGLSMRPVVRGAAVERPVPVRGRDRRSLWRWGSWALALVAASGFGALVRLCLIALAELTVYRVPYVGNALHSLEVAEFLNLLSFAVLGMGLGLASSIARSAVGVRLGTWLAIALVPLLFALSPMVRQFFWIEAIAADRAVPMEQAETMANQFLRDRVGSQGLWGFYQYTAQSAMVPVTEVEMARSAELDQQVNAMLAGLVGEENERVAGWIETGSWGLRAFYFLVAAASTASHFRRGVRLGERWW